MRRPQVPPSLATGPFTTAQAKSAGVTEAILQSSPWRHVFRGVWAHSDLPETREFRLAAVRLLLPPHAVLCGLTAAWLHDVDVRREDDLDIHVSFPKGMRRRRRPGVAVCQETLDPTDWLVYDGVRVTTPLRTAFDCLRLLPGAERLVVADALLHAGLVTLEDLRSYFSSKKRLRNLRRGEALLDDVEPLAESPMETRMRVEMMLGGLPRPVAQWNVRGHDGRFVARVDLAYPELKIAVEYDGAWHWRQRREDDRRRARLRALGWEVLVFDADDVFGKPIRMCAEIRRTLRARSAA